VKRTFSEEVVSGLVQGGIAILFPAEEKAAVITEKP
jgi:hypothetical protein